MKRNHGQSFHLEVVPEICCRAGHFHKELWVSGLVYSPWTPWKTGPQIPQLISDDNKQLFADVSSLRGYFHTVYSRLAISRWRDELFVVMTVEHAELWQNDCWTASRQGTDWNVMEHDGRTAKKSGLCYSAYSSFEVGLQEISSQCLGCFLLASWCENFNMIVAHLREKQPNTQDWGPHSAPWLHLIQGAAEQVQEYKPNTTEHFRIFGK